MLLRIDPPAPTDPATSSNQRRACGEHSVQARQARLPYTIAPFQGRYAAPPWAVWREFSLSCESPCGPSLGLQPHAIIGKCLGGLFTVFCRRVQASNSAVI